MDRYLGIAKKETETAIGINMQILTKFASSKKTLKQWMKLYPKAKKILLENNTELESFFKDFEDCTPVTEEEKKQAKKLYENIMKDD